jgi:hypothetical protein
MRKELRERFGAEKEKAGEPFSDREMILGTYRRSNREAVKKRDRE